MRKTRTLGALVAFLNMASSAWPLAVNAQVASPVDVVLRRDPDGITTATALIKDRFGEVHTGPPLPSPPDGPLQGREVTYYANSWTREANGSSTSMLTIGLQAAESTDSSSVRVPLLVIENAPAQSGSALELADLLAMAGELASDGSVITANSLGYLANYLIPDGAATVSSLDPGLTADPDQLVFLLIFVALLLLVIPVAGVLLALVILLVLFLVIVPLLPVLLPILQPFLPALDLFLRTLFPAISFFGLDGYPAATSSYQDYPTRYVWLVMQDEPRQVWAGIYIERTGSHQDGSSTASASKQVEIGAVTRVNGEEKRWAGAFLDQDIHRSLSPTDFHADNTLGAGASHLGREYRLAAVRMEEDRHDERGTLGSLPTEQRDEIAVAVYDPNDDFTPLVGTRSDNTLYASGDEAQTHLVSFGPYVAGQYQPVLGVRYHAERYPLTFWALIFALVGGGPGDQVAGDWQLEIGTFVDGEFVPVSGVELDDRWEGAQYPYQTMISYGVYVDGDFEPVLGVGYSGELPLVFWGLNFASAGGVGCKCQDWEIVTGTFVNDQYHPLLSVDYKDDYAEAKYAYQAMIIVGSYVAGRRMPLLAYTYAGELPLVSWGLLFADGGTLGAKTTDWRMEVGAFVGEVFKPLLTTEYRDDYALADHAYQAMVVVGTVVEGKDQPLLAYTYDGEQPLAQWALSFADGGGFGAQDALDWEMETGTFVDQTYVPLVGWTYANDFDGARRPYQSEVTAGAYVLGRYQPIAGFTYDGDGTVIDFANSPPAERRDLFVAAGTFTGGRYAPLVGAYYDGEHTTTTRVEDRVQVGTFVAGYPYFVPIAGASYEGDSSEDAWADSFVNGGGPGSTPGDAELRAHGYILEKPSAGVRARYRDDVTGERSREGTATVSGTTPGDGETERAVLRYQGENTLGACVENAQDPACRKTRVTVGTENPESGQFTPLAGADLETVPTPPSPSP